MDMWAYHTHGRSIYSSIIIIVIIHRRVTFKFVGSFFIQTSKDEGISPRGEGGQVITIFYFVIHIFFHSLLSNALFCLSLSNIVIIIVIL